ncbi:MAG: hypothetical protein MZW92_47135 [Comamonadaceae bacterium]|nr:hypothetical protein [Comamonadaceae bacterium]
MLAQLAGTSPWFAVERGDARPAARPSAGRRAAVGTLTSAVQLGFIAGRAGVRRCWPSPTASRRGASSCSARWPAPAVRRWRGTAPHRSTRCCSGARSPASAWPASTRSG